MQFWTYKQRFGYIIAPGSILAAGIGWAGHGDGRNNPDMQNVAYIGPLPCGWYTITAPEDSKQTGPYTLGLIPDKENEMFGRSDFRIHGAAFTNPQMSSDGCIIQLFAVRKKIWESGVPRLQVIRGDLSVLGVVRKAA